MSLRQTLFWIFIAAISIVLWNLFVPAPQKEGLIYFPKQELRIYAEVANSDLEREKGLMEHESLGQDRGMFFVFDSEIPQSFWMKNTKIPLDIIFISQDKRVVDIKENFQPCKSDICEIYTSRAPAKYALEINATLSGKRGVSIGDQALIPLNF